MLPCIGKLQCCVDGVRIWVPGYTALALWSFVMLTGTSAAETLLRFSLWLQALTGGELTCTDRHSTPSAHSIVMSEQARERWSCLQTRTLKANNHYSAAANRCTWQCGGRAKGRIYLILWHTQNTFLGPSPTPVADIHTVLISDRSKRWTMDILVLRYFKFYSFI